MVPIGTRYQKSYEYFVFENCTQIVHVYWFKNPVESLHIYSR